MSDVRWRWQAPPVQLEMDGTPEQLAAIEASASDDHAPEAGVDRVVLVVARGSFTQVDCATAAGYGFSRAQPCGVTTVDRLSRERAGLTEVSGSGAVKRLSSRVIRSLGLSRASAARRCSATRGSGARTSAITTRVSKAARGPSRSPGQVFR